MPRGSGRFDRGIRPLKSTENTDIIPAITDPIDDDEAVTGEIPVPDVEPEDETPDVPHDRLAELRDQAVGSADSCGGGWCTSPWCCWRGWRAKRVSGCLKPAAGCGRG